MADTVRLHDPHALDLSAGEYTGHWSAHFDGGYAHTEIDFPLDLTAAGLPGLVLVFWIDADDPANLVGAFDSTAPPAWATGWGSYIDDASFWPGLHTFGYPPWEELAPAVIFAVDAASDPDWWEHGPRIDSVSGIGGFITTGCEIVVHGLALSTVTDVIVGGVSCPFTLVDDTELRFGFPDVTAIAINLLLENADIVQATLVAPFGDAFANLFYPTLDGGPYEQVDPVQTGAGSDALFPYGSGRDNFQLVVHQRTVAGDTLTPPDADVIGGPLFRVDTAIGGGATRKGVFANTWKHDPAHIPPWFTWGFTGGPGYLTNGVPIGGSTFFSYGTADVLNFSAYAHPTLSYTIVAAARAVFAHSADVVVDHHDVAAVLLAPRLHLDDAYPVGISGGGSDPVGVISSRSEWPYDYLLGLDPCSYEANPSAGAEIFKQVYPPIGVPLSLALAVVFSGDLASPFHYVVVDLAQLTAGTVSFTGQRVVGAIPGMDVTLAPSPPAVRDAWRVDDTHVLILTGDDRLIAMDATGGTFGAAVTPSPLAAEPADSGGWHQRVAVTQIAPGEFYAVVQHAGGAYLDHYTVAGTVITRTSRLALPAHGFTFGVPTDVGQISFTHDIDTGDPYVVMTSMPIDPATGRMGRTNPTVLGLPQPQWKSLGQLYDFESGYMLTTGFVLGTRSYVVVPCTPFSGLSGWHWGSIPW